MPDSPESATARIPVKPTTLRRIKSTMGKSETYDEMINGVAERRETCRHDYGRRTAYKRVCRKCGAWSV